MLCSKDFIDRVYRDLISISHPTVARNSVRSRVVASVLGFRVQVFTVKDQNGYDVEDRILCDAGPTSDVDLAEVMAVRSLCNGVLERVRSQQQTKPIEP